MSPVTFTDTISVSYTATIDSGEVVDKIPENKPITVDIGSGKIFKAVEVCFLGMEPGEKKDIRILPEDAYGNYHKALVNEVPLSNFGNKLKPKPGMILSMALEKDGVSQQVPATVLGINNDSVTIDFNHPLAGKAINFSIKLHAIGR